MKKILLSIYLSIPLLCSGDVYYTKTTIEVAEQLRLPATLYKLRDKVRDFFEYYTISDKIDEQELRAHDLNYKAQVIQDIDISTEELLQERFDREFERIDRELFAGAQKLDQEEAPFAKKAAFIKTVKADAEQSINALIERYKKRR